MGGFDVGSMIAAGIMGGNYAEAQRKYGKSMIKEAQQLSAAWERPEMYVPSAVRAMVDSSQAMQYQNMPGYAVMQNQLNQATAGGVNRLQEMGTGAEAYGGIANLYAAQMGQQANLGVQNAAFQRQAQQQHLGSLQTLGDWQQQAWSWNEADPYLQAQQKAAQLEMMGRQAQWEAMATKYGSKMESALGAGAAIDDTADDIMSIIGGFMSDIRVKNIIDSPEMEGVLEKLDEIHPIKFTYKEDIGVKGGDVPQYGFIAQEVSAQFPDAATYDKEIDRFGIKPISLIAINTQAIKEAKTRMELLEERIRELENQQKKE